MSANVEKISSQKNSHEESTILKLVNLNAQAQETLPSYFTINKNETISASAHTQLNHQCYEDDSRLYRRESLPTIPTAPIPAPQPCTSLVLLHGNNGYTNSKYYRNRLNSDSVCQESLSREFNDSSFSTNALENSSNSSVSAPAVSSLSSSSSLHISSSSPSICCYTIARKSNSKQGLRNNSNINVSSNKINASHPFIEKNLNQGYTGSVGVGKNRSSAIAKSIKLKVSPPPVPPKPTKKKRSNKGKTHVHQCTKHQEKTSTFSLPYNSYYNPASFQRKLQKFEKQNTINEKSKNNVTRASHKHEDDQGDERCEFLGCFSARNNTNSNQSTSGYSCVGSIKSVSGGEQDRDILYTAITSSNNRTNNINNNNNSNAIDREQTLLSGGREWRVNDERKDSIRSTKRTLRNDSFGYLESADHRIAYQNRSVSEAPLCEISFKPSISVSSVGLPSDVVIRKLTPKLSKQLNFLTDEIPSRSCISDDNPSSSIKQYVDNQSAYNFNIEQTKFPAVTQNTSNVALLDYCYQKSVTSSFSESASPSDPSVNDIDFDTYRIKDHHYRPEQPNNERNHNIFESLSNTYNANLSKSLTSGQSIGVRKNYDTFYYCLPTTDVQDCNLSDVDINNSLNYENKKYFCECDNNEPQCHTVNNECVVEKCSHHKIAQYRYYLTSDPQYQTLVEDKSNSIEISNLPRYIDTTDSFSGNSSNSSSAHSFSSPTVPSPLFLKGIPVIESFGYEPQCHATGAVCKEIMMEKRRNTLDRWQRLGFGRRSSPTPASGEKTRKSSDKTERLKELTELLRRNRSSPTPPPIPPPRKSRNAVSATNSLEKPEDTPFHSLATHSDEILLMDHDDDKVLTGPLNGPSAILHEQNVASSSATSKGVHKSIKPNTSLINFETLLSKETSNSPTRDPLDVDISTKLSRPESRTVIGSYTRKGIPFRSASFSQIDLSSGKYIGATINALRDRLRHDKTSESVCDDDPQKKDEVKIDESYSNEKTDGDFIYIKYNMQEPNKNSNYDDIDRSTQDIILEEDHLPVENDYKYDENTEDDKINEVVIEGCDAEGEKVPLTFDEKIAETMSTCVDQIPQSSMLNDIPDLFEPNLATLVEEEIPLESPPDTFLQTATTCLIPVPVYECAAQVWSLENPPHEWVDVAPDEFGMFPESVNAIAPTTVEVALEKRECDQIRETVPKISVSQHTSTHLEEIVKTTEEDDAFLENVAHHRVNSSNPNDCFDYTEVKKRYSHDDMEIGTEKRSSLDCSLQRLCSNTEERKRIDKSKRRKGMYIESSDWVGNPEERNSRGLNLELSLTNFGVIKDDQPGECSPVMYLNSQSAEDNQTPGSLYSLDLNTPDSECNKSPIWATARHRTYFSCQSSEEKDDGTPIAPMSEKSRTFLSTESVSDNESDRTPTTPRDRSSPSPALSDQDFKRYSKRPLRGPYGQMLEAEMKKPNRLHFEEILEELKDPESSVRRTRGGHYDTRSFEDHPRNLPQYSNSFRARKPSTYLPIPTHARAASTPSQIENVARASDLSKANSSEKRYQSTLDNSTISDTKSYSEINPRSIHKKSSSLVPLDKPKQSMDEIRMTQSNRSPSERSVLTEGKGNGKDLMPTPELLAELLQGASEKLVSEQRQQMFADTRTHVVQEIFRNEQSYVESLQTVVLKYFKVLKTPEHAGMIDSRTVDEIFFMVPNILAIHEKFLSELKGRLDTWEPQQKVGDAFIETFSKTEVLEVYTSFVNNCNRAKNAIRTTKQCRPSFARFLESTAREHRGKLTLDNLLIKPVQKFPNYEMLFTRLIKHTDGDHPDQKHLQEVLKLVHDTLVHINCKEREISENGQREATLRELEGIIEGITELVAPDRQFLIFDLVSMPSGQGARKERGFFLFNDLLVITSIKRRSGTIRKPNTTSCPGSVASTLDTNKYKFLTKVSLDNLEIIKSKDESLRKIMNEIEQLADDCNKLQQIAEVTSSIKYPHQVLEDVIRDLHRDVQRQLSERQSNDAQLNMLELTVNSPNGSQKISIIFSKAEKRSQWEEAFTEAKQKLAATLERHPVPEFLTSIPIVKTRAGLQFTCAAPTLSDQKDVWVCNSDGYVGQVCVMSLSPEPNVTSCNGVCNARILSLASVPACNNSGNKSQRSSLNEETIVREFRKSSSPNFHTNQNEKKKSSTNVATTSDIQLDSNSSSDDSEPETPLHRDRIRSPSPAYAPGLSASHAHQTQDSIPDESEGNQSTMWLGTEDGYIHVYNCTDTIRIKKNKIKIQHASAVYSILYLDNRVFVSLANGDICVYLRDSVGWNTNSPLCISIGTVSSPVNKLLNVHGKLWCSIQGIIKVLDTKTLQVVNQIQISSDSKPITNMAVSNIYVWISIQNSAHIKCFHSNTHQLVTEVNLAPAVNKMLSNCDDIIRQHKAACLRVTSLLSCKDLIWIGTSAGVLLTIPALSFEKGSPNVVPTGIPHGHTGHVRFLTFVETPPMQNSSSKLPDESASTDYKNRRSSKHSKTKSETGNILIISGGDGYEDFRNSGANSLSEIAGREDSTNHLLIWQI